MGRFGGEPLALQTAAVAAGIYRADRGVTRPRYIAGPRASGRKTDIDRQTELRRFLQACSRVPIDKRYAGIAPALLHWSVRFIRDPVKLEIEDAAGVRHEHYPCQTAAQWQKASGALHRAQRHELNQAAKDRRELPHRALKGSAKGARQSSNHLTKTLSSVCRGIMK